MSDTLYHYDELIEEGTVSQEELQLWLSEGLLIPEGYADEEKPFFNGGVKEQISQLQSLHSLGYSADDIKRIVKKVGLPSSGPDRKKSQAKPLLTVGALAEQVGVSPRTIKHWEDKGIIVPDMRSRGGFRLYQNHYVFLCLLIQDLQHFGYSLDEIKTVSLYFRRYLYLKEHLQETEQEVSAGELAGMQSEIEKLELTMTNLKKGISRWEDLLKKHKRGVNALAQRNSKRRDEQ